MKLLIDGWSWEEGWGHGQRLLNVSHRFWASAFPLPRTRPYYFSVLQLLGFHYTPFRGKDPCKTDIHRPVVMIIPGCTLSPSDRTNSPSPPHITLQAHQHQKMLPAHFEPTAAGPFCVLARSIQDRLLLYQPSHPKLRAAERCDPIFNAFPISRSNGGGLVYPYQDACRPNPIPRALGRVACPPSLPSLQPSLLV